MGALFGKGLIARGVKTLARNFQGSNRNLCREWGHCRGDARGESSRCLPVTTRRCGPMVGCPLVSCLERGTCENGCLVLPRVSPDRGRVRCAGRKEGGTPAARRVVAAARSYAAVGGGARGRGRGRGGAGPAPRRRRRHRGLA